MSRYAEQQATPPQPTVEGDSSFEGGMNMKLDRSQLPAGTYPLLINGRSNAQVITKRRGTVKPTFANVIAFAAILGSGVYSNPNGDEVLLVAAPSQVVAIKDASYPNTVALPNGVTLSGVVEFAQHFDKVLLHAPAISKTFVWDGLDPAGFVEITKSDPLDGSSVLVPEVAPWSLNFGFRAIFPVDTDSLAASNLLDYTSYDPINNLYRINTGTADELVGAFPYLRSNVLVGKRRSWDVLVNFTGNLSGATMQQLSTTIGLAARKTAKLVGSDYWFLYDQGLFTISTVDQDRVQSNPIPISDPVEPLMRRITAGAIAQATAAVHGYYYFLAMPLDGSTVNNAVGVFNTVTRVCEAYDTWGAAISIDDLHVTKYQGTPRVFAVDKVAKAVYVLYEGLTDVLASGEIERTMTFESRGYATLGWNAATNRNARRCEIAISTLRPSITVTEITDKASDERNLTPTAMTKSAAKYDRFGVADYLLDNTNNDFDVIGRQDYSVPDGVYLQNGISFEKKQQSVLRFALKARGRYHAFRLISSQGETDINGILLESSGSQREAKRAA